MKLGMGLQAEGIGTVSALASCVVWGVCIGPYAWAVIGVWSGLASGASMGLLLAVMSTGTCSCL